MEYSYKLKFQKVVFLVLAAFFSMPACHKQIGIGNCVMDNKEGLNIIFKKQED